MDTAQIVTYVLQGAATLLIGALGFFLKRTLDDFRKAIKENREEYQKSEAELKKLIESTDGKAETLRADLAQLKADLPLVYTLREDFIRTLNNVDKKMGDMDGKLDRLLQKQ